jgi:hypothetical protein
MVEPKASDERLPELIALTVVIGLILGFCGNLIISDQVPFFRDLGNYFYPLRWSLYESYILGELPLWNRHFAQGFPLLAAFQTGTFYVPHALLIVLPFFVAIRTLFVFHFLIAGIGTYTLLRYWRYPPHLSIVGGLLFTLGGSVVSLSNLLNHFQAAVWLPWVLLTWERLLSSPRWSTFIVFTLLVTVQFLAGSPELFVMSMAFVLIDGFRLRCTQPEISCRRILGLFSGGITLVLAIAMAQLLPTAELFLESRRQHPIPIDEALSWSLRPSNLVNLFVIDKEIDLTRFTGIRPLLLREVPYYVSSYLGAISVFGISLWCLYSSNRERVFGIALLLASLALALGGHTPIFPFLFTHVPLFSAVRFPEKFFFVTAVLLLFMTMRGLGDLLRERKRPTQLLIAFGSICLTWLTVYLVLRFNSDFLHHLIAGDSVSPQLSDIQIRTSASLLINIERQLILSIVISGLLYLANKKAIRIPVFAVLLVSIVYVDLAWAHRGFLFALRPGFVHTGARIISGAETKMSRVFYHPSLRNLHPAFVAVRGNPPFKEAIALSFHNVLPNAGILYNVDYMQEIDALGRQPYTDFLYFANNLDLARQVKLLRTFNVGYLVSFRSLSDDGIYLAGEFPEYFSWLYKIERPLPRSYIVNKSVVETTPVRTLETLASPEFEPTQEVILDQETGIKSRYPLIAAVDIVRYEHQSVSIHASLNDSGILVIADSYYPGWKAYVDGKEVPIMRANHFFRAVALSEGQHVVEFKYEPLSFKIGLLISLTTIIALVIISMIVFLRNRKRTRYPNEAYHVRL